MPAWLENARTTTGTAVRMPRDPSPLSGMCALCIHDCTVLCELTKAAFRGREVLYPSPEEFGSSTAASNKDYFLDWSHFQIMVNVLGAQGIAPDPDVAIFPNVDISTNVGGIPLRVPVLVAALGSTQVAKANWDGLAMGTALSGTIMTIGENVCGMDPQATYDADGKVTYSADMDYRINTYRKYWDGVHGDIICQTNVEDQRGGVDLYVMNKLGVTIIERKWGQGAKAIGGEVRISDLDRAVMLKRRGYVVLPDPEDQAVQEAFRDGVFDSFERHSRVGMPNEVDFVRDIEWLREQGAKKVFLKTGAYNPAVVAFTLKCASQAKIDAITFDGAGGGTGMSPVPMMNECATPTIYLLAQVLECLRILRMKGKYIPDIIFAGGFVNETQILKAMAMSNLGDGHGPYIKAIAMARAPICAVQASDYHARLAAEGRLPRAFARLYGTEPDRFFVKAYELRQQYGDEVGAELPWPAVGLYTYFTDRIGVGLQQLLAAARKWRLDLLDRSDIASLTEQAAMVTGIPTLWSVDHRVFERILDF